MWQLALPPDISAAGALFLFAVAGLAGLVRGYAGFGAAMVFVPLAALVLDPVATVVVVLIIDVAASLILAAGALRRARLRPVALLFLGAAAGVPLGVRALGAIDPVTFRWLAGVLILLALGGLLSGWRYRDRPGAAATVAVGALSGFMGGFTALAGPPVVLFFLGGPDEAARVRASIIVYFLGTAALSFLSFAMRGLLDGGLMRLALALSPPYLAGTLAGMMLFRLAGDARFRYVACALIALAAVLALPLWER
ncbi:MAG: sulfite exporter TauE/SafE family protein [Alphaproteobacteria bacterium]|nr:MAG: sulfite exporter TauE/SafE family protein [Alphaproteobacteria bacterium]